MTAEIRPRTEWEAVDLGFAMTRRDFWRCVLVWWLAMCVPFAVAAWFFREVPLLLLPLFWWFKPVGSRMVLFELSRRLFGEKPSWKAIFRSIPGAWGRRFFYRLVWARFSPWLPVMLAVEDLEGLRGKAYSRRSVQVASRGDGVVMWFYLLSDLAALWVGICVFAFIVMFIPEGQEGPWYVAMETFDPSRPQDIPAVISWSATLSLMAGISLVDVFVTGAGFGIYVNNRTWLEGWDVELAFKRLGKRLAGIAACILMGFCLVSPATVRADEAAGVRAVDAEVIRGVKEDKDFKVHEQVSKHLKSKPGKGWNLSGLGAFASIIGWTFVVLFIALLAWLVWINRHVFRLKGRGDRDLKKQPAAKVVMGMEVTAESLPKDIPVRVMQLWREGRHHEAMALLYRGTISKVIDAGEVEIRESDTEGDCLRRVEEAGPAAHPGYFRGLTKIWMRLAYAGEAPREMDVESLCREWPFVERRSA